GISGFFDDFGIGGNRPVFTSAELASRDAYADLMKSAAVLGSSGPQMLVKNFNKKHNDDPDVVNAEKLAQLIKEDAKTLSKLESAVVVPYLKASADAMESLVQDA